MVVTAQTYEQFALEHPDEAWELHRGQLREKPAMSAIHSSVIFHLARSLMLQLDPHEFHVRINIGRIRHSAESYYIPDVFVVPYERVQALLTRPEQLDVYTEPLPLVVEVWSPSTGDYDVDAKLPAYRERGDLEIWRIQPYERTLTAWRRQADSGYTETLHGGGTVRSVALPGVTIDLNALFD